MSKYEYTDFEKQINSVLKHQSEELSNIKFPSSDSLDESIASSEAMLTRLGYSINKQCCPTVESVTPVRKVLVVPTWEELCTEAEKHVGTGCDLESIFTEEELQSNEEAIRLLRSEYSSVHRLDRFDVSISALAGIVGALINILLVGIPQKEPDGLTGGSLSNYIRSYFDKKFPAAEMQKLANSKESKVSFDAQDNRNTTEYVEGMSAYYHRLLSLGHDPTVHHVSTHTKALEIIEYIRFYALQTRFRALNAVGFNAKGQILGLCQAVIALGKLVLKHCGILSAYIVKGVALLGNEDGLLEVFHAHGEVQKGKLELDRTVEVIEEVAPPVKNGRLILVLCQLVVDVLKLYGLCVERISYPADTVRPNALIRN